MEHFEIAVVGAGLAGSLAALAVADTGRSIALIAPVAGKADGRTTALMDQSIELVRKLGLWQAVAPLAAPLSSMRIIDATNRLLRAPTVTFHAAEVGLEAFGYNIPNAPFLTLLEQETAKRPTFTRLVASLAQVEFEPERAVLTLDDGRTITASLVIGADGRKSGVRAAAGIEVRNWSYPQSALVLNFSHQVPHQNISTEFHTPHGPFTQVPLPGGLRSSLVWVQKPEDTEAALALSPDALALAVEQRMQSMLGKVVIEGAAQSFPLSGMTAHAFGKGRAVLIGEAAHAFPPIGAQGLNLSLRDIMAALSLLGYSPVPDDFGGRYDRKRRADILSRTVSVDLLNRSLLSDFLPVQMLRAAGLQALASVAPLRNLMMREGINPGSALQSLRGALREKIGRKSA
ncbi:UbiH/UbiF family hydroxylase [Rhizobium sp. LjRoot98]|uniref:UbiH/UbiF family hydroxylase n=1 Tax=unclassified Rhizobium TaxID=2613769 RepID=UPI000713D9BF|nr:MULTISPECIES: UbiH/UbiF family hydroxylase [unclassified Rhizobium]KQV31180.1 2-octaprenyl-6-methoxyphenyl hydroxylase [Rhizobium sp. Root1204]KQY10873.1 2-octaprenyl-6-methoxyphenyl hydroxylase [Rhizobium sp. Root1334]KRC04857.1 2-octaprenyl-6-methoxyphenyl hydroxylase [Rhizobium sp. Root73]